MKISPEKSSPVKSSPGFGPGRAFTHQWRAYYRQWLIHGGIDRGEYLIVGSEMSAAVAGFCLVTRSSLIPGE